MATAATETSCGTDRITYAATYSSSSDRPSSSSTVDRRGVLVACVVAPGRDVVDVDRCVVLEIVDGVDAAAAAFLDRTARLVLLLRALLAAQALGRRRRTEVGAAVAAAGSGRAAGTRARAEAAAAAGPRAAEPPPPPPKPPTAGRGHRSRRPAGREASARAAAADDPRARALR